MGKTKEGNQAMPKTSVEKSVQESAAEAVAQRIRENIISGQLKPGNKLREAEICKWLQVSRTPVREAFRVLQSEGFVTHNPNYGVVVASLGVDDVVHLYKIRGVLEQISAYDAAVHITKEQIAELKKINEDLKIFDETDPQKSSDLDLRFHSVIAQASRNNILIECLSGIYRKTAMVLRLSPFQKARITQTCKEHTDIISAIESGDSELAKKYMEIHFYKSTDSLVKKAIAYNQIPQLSCGSAKV
ncbi:MAG: GntR family transcriptional regulator [Treponema sp.]|jgi:DNA-binding GntR family transcriptional regulator|nr:GntR family transcriptional regulator [Treponema sp.]